MADLQIDVLAGRTVDAWRAIATIPSGTERGLHLHPDRQAVNWRATLDSAKAWTDIIDNVQMEDDPSNLGREEWLGSDFLIDVDIASTAGSGSKPKKLALKIFGDNTPATTGKPPDEGKGSADLEEPPTTSASTPLPAAAMSAVREMEARNLWIIAGSEMHAANQEPKDRSDPLAFLPQEQLARVKARLGSVESKPLDMVVLSIAGVERLAAGRFSSGPGRSFARPLAVFLDQPTMLDLLSMQLARMPHFVDMLNSLVTWQQGDPVKRKLFVQPMSANGFTLDDGMPNVDRATGKPLVTCRGVIGSAARLNSGGAGHAGFPRDDNELPEWMPFCSAEPALSIIFGQAGRFSIDAGDLLIGILALKVPETLLVSSRA